MSDSFAIVRKIGIDAGHRIPDHKSKCKNVHGHRYVIEATCVGPLFITGEQKGMVLDFGFLKEEMVNEIDKPCDHGLILSIHDPILNHLLNTAMYPGCWDEAADAIGRRGCWALNDYSGSDGDVARSIVGKLYVIEDVPTAENLAKHWHDRLAPRVGERSNLVAWLKKVRVWETPNCYAEYEVSS